MSHIIERRESGVITHKNVDPDSMVFEGGIETYDTVESLEIALEK